MGGLQMLVSVMNLYFDLGFDQRFPTWGTCTPSGTLPIWRDTFKVNKIEEKIYLYIIYFLYLYIYQWIAFLKIICFLVNISTLRHQNKLPLQFYKSEKFYSMDFCYFTQPFCHMKHVHLSKILKGYREMVRERSGNSWLWQLNKWFNWPPGIHPNVEDLELFLNKQFFSTATSLFLCFY